MARNDDFEDDDIDESEDTEVEITEEQFSEYNCPHCGKPIQIILTPGGDDEDSDDDL